MKEKKVDIGVDTNMSELKKIRYIERIAEETKDYWEQTCKKCQKKLSALEENILIEKTNHRKEIVQLKYQLQKTEESKI